MYPKSFHFSHPSNLDVWIIHIQICCLQVNNDRETRTLQKPDVMHLYYMDLQQPHYNYRKHKVFFPKLDLQVNWTTLDTSVSSSVDSETLNPILCCNCQLSRHLFSIIFDCRFPTNSNFRVRVTLQLAVYRQSVSLGAKALEIQDQYFFQPNKRCYSHYIASSLTRRGVYRLQLFLVFASAVILGSESRRTHDHILLSRIRDYPCLEGQIPVFISPRNRVAQF
jgi:hypothetical protein